MRADDIMTRNVITVSPDTDVAEVARLMLEKRISGLPVVENGAPIGIISESDLLRRPETGTEWHAPSWLELFLSRSSLAAEYVRTHARSARDVMTRELITVSEDTPVSEIAELMEQHRIKRVPVIGQDGRLIGIISRVNLLRGLAGAARPPAAAAASDDLRIRAVQLGFGCLWPGPALLSGGDLGPPGAGPLALIKAAGAAQVGRCGVASQRAWRTGFARLCRWRSSWRA